MQVVKKITKPFTPSAFQIRFAGFKGVLALDPTLPGKQAVFRSSMCKFESFHRRLEVLQKSRPQVVYLNHQVIMLLSNLGVPDEVFIALQNDMLERLAGKQNEACDYLSFWGSFSESLVLKQSFSELLGRSKNPNHSSVCFHIYRQL